jgi:hypothetical protein
MRPAEIFDAGTFVGLGAPSGDGAPPFGRSL